MVAIRRQEPPVIVELKTAFSLALVFQPIARQGLSDDVYLAVPPFSSRGVRLRDTLPLCHKLGLGLLTVRLEPAPFVEASLDPAPYQPRKRKQATGRLLRELQQRVGDPNQEIGVNRLKIITVYRQDALRCAMHLHRHGPSKAVAVAESTGVGRARAIMYADHYGWFESAAHTPRGIYTMTSKGRQALEADADAVATLKHARG